MGVKFNLVSGVFASLTSTFGNLSLSSNFFFSQNRIRIRRILLLGYMGAILGACGGYCMHAAMQSSHVQVLRALDAREWCSEGYRLQLQRQLLCQLVFRSSRIRRNCNNKVVSWS